MAGHAGRGRRFERFRRVVGGIAATLAVATAVVDAPRPATGAPAQTDGPEVTVSPAENLTDGAVLAVTGTGLVPGHRYGVHQCEARTTAIYEGCDFTENAWGEADWPAGSIELWFRADTILTTGRGTTDCRVEDACIVALVSDVGVAATAALHFDPTAEPAPPPRLTVAPEDGLFHGLEVAFESQGFVWGGDITLRQCVTGAVEPDMCDAETARSFPSGLEDKIAGTFAVSAEIHTAERAAVDCREEGACSLVASIAGGMNPVQTASTELRFDPTVPLPEPPQIVAEHNIDLFDGQVIGLSGTGFARGRLVGIYQCGARPHWGNCRLIETVIRPDEAGAFRAEISLSAVLNTAFGQIDCRVSDEACVLVAANGFNPGSPRAAQTTLHFDPDAPLRPTPRLTVSPASGLVDGATVSVEGVGWTRWAIDLRLCAANAPSPQWLRCDSQQSKDVLPTHEGAFRTELHVNEAFASQPDEQSVDCGVTPGCAVVATDVRSGRSVSVPITFEGAAPPRRYLDPVFDGVQATYNVVYRDTVDSRGRPIQMKMDIFQPAGDTAEKRPAIVWMHGGYFRFGDKANIDDYARDAARRGYVGISLGYRYRSDLWCCPPTWDDENFIGAAHDAYDDALAGVDWLKEHAADYRIDPQTIIAGGNDAGGFTSLNLAYMPGQGGPARSSIAAVLAIDAAGTFGAIDPGEPPVMSFHAAIDEEFPYGLPEDICRSAQMVGVRCDAVTFDGDEIDIVATRRPSIMRRSMDFLAETVLGPRGYLDATAPGPGNPGTTSTTTVAGDATTPTTAARRTEGDLPRTGSDSLPLLRLGLALAIGGATLALLSRHHLSRTG